MNRKLQFQVPDGTSLSLSAILITMPNIRNIVKELPPQLEIATTASISAFSYDPDSNEFHLSGTLGKLVIAPHFLSLQNNRVTMVLALSTSI